jgi:hypothetical protein
MKRVCDSLHYQYEQLEKTKAQLHDAGQSSLVPLLRPLLNSADLVFAAYDEHEKKEAARRAKMASAASTQAQNQGKRPAVAPPGAPQSASDAAKRARVAT